MLCSQRLLQSGARSDLEVFELPVVFLMHLLGIRVLLQRLGVVIVKISRVSWTTQMRHNWTLHSTVIERIPVDILEPRMCFNGLGAAPDIAEPLRHVNITETGDDVACVA